MAKDTHLEFSVVEALIRATAAGVARGVLDACAAEAEAVGDGETTLGGPQVWDGQCNIQDNGSTQLGKVTGWLGGDQVLEVAEFDNQTDLQSFLTNTFRLSGHSTVSTKPFDLISSFEAGYSATATRRWAQLIGTHVTGLSASAAEALQVVHSSGAGTITWWKITQVLSGATKNVGFLYRLVESGTAPSRVYDQWFLSEHYAGPAVADVIVTPLGTAPTFTQAVAAVDDDWDGTPTWIVQKFAWHVRPTS